MTEKVYTDMDGGYKISSKPDPMNELEMIFTEIAAGPNGHGAMDSGFSLSGIEPAEDPVAELEALDGLDDGEKCDEIMALRSSIEDLKTHLATATTRADKLDRDLDDVVNHTQEARLYIRSALAIIHLQQHDPTSLSSNAMAGVFEALSNAAHDLEKAEIKADRIPF